jgi:prepilin-type N-terminal cleavage/methylation domain-containing protein
MALANENFAFREKNLSKNEDLVFTFPIVLGNYIVYPSRIHPAMTAKSHPADRFSPKNGFTLVELLVVIAIIAGLLAMAGSMIGGNNDSQNTRTASKDLRGMIELAQARAITSGNQTAVIICKKTNDDRNRRFAMVVERTLRANSTTAYEWRPVGNGSTFPNGINYWSEKSFNDTFPSSDPLILGTAFSGVNRSDWIGILFNPQGVPMGGSGPLSQNPVFLVAPGYVEGASLKVNESEKRLSLGFMLQRSNGRVIDIESPIDQLSL